MNKEPSLSICVLLSAPGVSQCIFFKLYFFLPFTLFFDKAPKLSNRSNLDVARTKEFLLSYRQLAFVYKATSSNVIISILLELLTHLT